MISNLTCCLFLGLSNRLLYNRFNYFLNFAIFPYSFLNEEFYLGNMVIISSKLIKEFTENKQKLLGGEQTEKDRIFKQQK